MILSREIRDSMLRKEWDISRADIAAAIRDTIKIKNQRRQTVQNLNKDKVEELFEGASKKIFRSLMFKSSTTSELDMLNQQYMAVQELRQQEMKLAQQNQRQPLGNDTRSSDSGKDIADGLMIVGLNIDDDEIIEDLEDNEDDNAEHKEDLPSAATANKMMKKPIMIVENDDDAAIFMNVETRKDHTTTSTGTPSLDHTEPEHRQYKGENSSEDGSTNLNSSHHKVASDNNKMPSNYSTTSSATTTSTTGVGEVNVRNTAEI